MSEIPRPVLYVYAYMTVGLVGLVTYVIWGY